MTQTAYIYSVVLIAPADHRDAANALGEAMGWGPNNYSVPLSADGSAPATHYGCRADATQEFVDMLANPPAEAVGAQDVIAALTACDIKLLTEIASSKAHAEAVLAAHGLQYVEVAS